MADEPDGAQLGGEAEAVTVKGGEVLKRSLSEPPRPHNGSTGVRTIKAMGNRQFSKTKNA